MASRLGNATPGRLVQIAGLGRNQLNEEVLQHPGETIVGHDPDAEARTAGVDYIQPVYGNPIWQPVKFASAPRPELIPAGLSITIRINDDAQRFEPRSPQFSLNDCRFQELPRVNSQLI